MNRLAYVAGAAGLLFIAGCSSSWFSDAPPPSTGYAVGDEPTAVKIASQVLAQGGSAADAATAMYFTMSVAYPVAAGLGGGGICIVHDPARGENEMIDFLPRDPAGGGDYAMPGAVRGMEALQGTYGRLPWQRAIGPAEGMAGAGFAISHALEQRLLASQNAVRLDADLAAEFIDESGALRKEGSVVSNADLAATLARIRESGANGFYRGAVAQAIADYAASQGGKITADELSAYAAQREAASAMALGQRTGYLVSPRLGAGKFADVLFRRLVSDVAAAPNLRNLTAASTKQALDEFKIASLPADLGATGFATADSAGQAVACAVTMNGPFGSGHTVPKTGVTLATAPAKGSTGLSPAFLAPAIVLESDGSLLFAGAGAGGPNGSAAIGYELARIARGDDLLQGGSVNVTGLEPASTINFIACRSGACIAVADPLASGLGVSVAQ